MRIPRSSAGVLRQSHLIALPVLILLISAAPASGAIQGDSTYALPVKAGWNLLSLPVEVIGSTQGGIFPSAVSNAYLYHAGYDAVDTLDLGEGFWIKFAEAETVQVSGDVTYATTMHLAAGWNIIGGLTAPFPVSALATSPPGAVVSAYYGYIPEIGYQSTDTLYPGMGYWVKAAQAATMSATIFGMPCPGMETVDYGGMMYNTVQIREQCWMSENLNIGVLLNSPLVTTDNDTIERYCYNNDTANCTLLGGLYRWDEAMRYTKTPGTEGICPEGWHIPTRSEFDTLSAIVGDDGNALKAIGQGVAGGIGTNTSGFSAMLAGYSSGIGSFIDSSYAVLYWGSTEFSATEADHLGLVRSGNFVNLYYSEKTAGYSVRCLHNSGAPPDPPSIPSPPDNADSLFTSVAFTWECGDADLDQITYDLYLGTDNPPMTRVHSSRVPLSTRHGAMLENTTYYWRVVARDEHGNSTEGPVWTFSTGGPFGLPCPGTPTVDYGGKTYNTVQIGGQCWLRENLDIGTLIDSLQNATDNDTIEKYCYNNDTANCTLYGGLYQQNEAVQYLAFEGVQGICPTGWHMPTQGEYDDLMHAVGDDGNALKAVGQGAGDGAGSNSSGFSALLAGGRYHPGYFNGTGNDGWFWSSSAWFPTPEYPEYLNLNSGDDLIEIYSYPKKTGFSVRCLED